MDTEHTTLHTVFNPLRRGSFVSDQPEHRASFGFPGWYPDPSGGHELRFWDGAVWTNRVRDGDTPARTLSESTFEKVMNVIAGAVILVFILVLTVGGGVVLGSWFAALVSRCESWGCIAPGSIGAVLGGVVGLVGGISLAVWIRRLLRPG